MISLQSLSTLCLSYIFMCWHVYMYQSVLVMWPSKTTITSIFKCTCQVRPTYIITYTWLKLFIFLTQLMIFSIVISITTLTTSDVYFGLKSIWSHTILVSFYLFKSQWWLSWLFVTCITVYILKSIWSHSNILCIHYDLYFLLFTYIFVICIYVYWTFVALVEPP